MMSVGLNCIRVQYRTVYCIYVLFCFSSEAKAYSNKGTNNTPFFSFSLAIPFAFSFSDYLFIYLFIISYVFG